MAFLKRRILHIGAGLVLLLLILVAVLFAITPEPAERHRPLAYTDRFDFSTGSFAAYTDFALGRLRVARGEAADAALLANLAPFRLEPGAECPRAADGRFANGIVLTHDLLESPYAMRDIGQYFQSRCFLVLGVLLPGHGTRPGDLPQTTWQDWAEVQSFATAALATEAENVVLAGHGVGGTLALLEATRNPAVRSLILFAPALGAGTASWFDALVAPLGALLPRLRWAAILPDDASYGYESRPWSASAETAALAQTTDAALANQALAIPVFTVASIEDSTVSTAAILAFMADQTHPASHTLLYTSEPKPPAQPNITTVSTHYPEMQILSMAHPGLMIPASNRYYGWNGAYRNCAHYYQAERAAYQRCKAGERRYYAEISAENREEGLVERLMFNPFYPDLEDSLDRFLFPGSPSRRQDAI